jgi:hypothetical protein
MRKMFSVFGISALGLVLGLCCMTAGCNPSDQQQIAGRYVRVDSTDVFIIYDTLDITRQKGRAGQDLFAINWRSFTDYYDSTTADVYREHPAILAHYDSSTSLLVSSDSEVDIEVDLCNGQVYYGPDVYTRKK